jgi:hypothetical protein
MKRSIKHGGSVAVRFGAALGLTTVGVAAVAAAPAYAQSSSVVQVQSISLSPANLAFSKTEFTVTLGSALPNGVSAVLVTSYGSSTLMSPPNSSLGSTLDFTVPGPDRWVQGSTVYAELVLYAGMGPNSTLTPASPALWELTLSSSSGTVGRQYPMTPVPTVTSANLSLGKPVAHLGSGGSTATVDLPFTGLGSHSSPTIDYYQVYAVTSSGQVIDSYQIAPTASGSYSAEFHGLTFGDLYRFYVVPFFDNNGTPMPGSPQFTSLTIPSQADLIPTSLPQVSNVTETPGYKDASTFATPTETLTWDPVAATTFNGETFTPKSYTVTLQARGSSQQVTQTVTSPSAIFDVTAGATYDYSIAVNWSVSPSGTIITGKAVTGTFVANSALGTPTIASLGSYENASGQLVIAGSVNPVTGLPAGVDAQYQVVLQDGTKTYDVFASPVTNPGSFDFAVTSGSGFAFALGDQVTATVEATFYYDGSEVGVSYATPKTITVTNSTNLPAPTGVTFLTARQQLGEGSASNLGGIVSWTGPAANAVPKGYTLDNYVVEVFEDDPHGGMRPIYVDNTIPVTDGTSYNVDIPATVLGYASANMLTARVFAVYTDKAGPTSPIVVGSMSSHASLYLPSTSFAWNSSGDLSATAVYADGQPGIHVSWKAAPSIALPDGSTTQLPPVSYTVAYIDTSSSGAATQYVTVTGTSTTLTDLVPGDDYDVLAVAANYPLLGLDQGTFVGAVLSPYPSPEVATYDALPTPSLSSPSFATTAGTLEMSTTIATGLPAQDPSALTASYWVKVTNATTGQTHTFGPYADPSDGPSVPVTIPSTQSFAFGPGSLLEVSVTADYSLNGQSVGSVTSGITSATVTDAALELPGVTHLVGSVVNDQSGSPTLANLAFDVPTGPVSSGYSLEGYDIVATGVSGSGAKAPNLLAYVPMSPYGTPSSNVVNFDCTKGTCAVLLSGLHPGWSYDFTVIPVYANNGATVLGQGTSMSSPLVMTNGISLAVSNITLAPGEQGSEPTLTANWDAPANLAASGLSVFGYDVSLWRQGASGWVLVQGPTEVAAVPGVNSTTFSGLTQSESYEVQIAAILEGSNGIVLGPTVTSSPIAENLNENPAPPTNVNLAQPANTAGELTLTWSEQSGANFAPPLSFTLNLMGDGQTVQKLTVNADALHSTTANGTTTYTYTFTGLYNGVYYTATVTSYSGLNATGNMGGSGTSQALTIANSLVSNVSVNPVASGTVKVTFTGVSGVSQYEVEVLTADGSIVSGPETATASAMSYSAIFDDLPTDKTLYVEIMPELPSGSMGLVYQQPFVAYAAPNAVTNLMATPVGSKAVDLAWSAPTPTNNASDPIVGYVVSWWANGHELGSIQTPDTSYEVTDLTPGVNYTFQVVTVDKLGLKSAPAQVSAIPVGTTAGAPLDLAATPSAGSIALTWQSPSAASLEGNTLTGVYQVTWMDVTNPSASVTEDVSVESYTITGLTNGDTYLVTVEAQVQDPNTGQVFWSEPASLQSAETTPMAPPAAVTNLGAYVSGGHVVVNWSPSATATNYLVSVDGETRVATNDATTYAFPVGTGDEYTIEVYAENAYGTSGPAEVTEWVASSPIRAKLAPDAPTTTPSGTMPSTEAPSGSSDVTVSFLAPTSLGSADISSYQVTLYQVGSNQMVDSPRVIPATEVLQGPNGAYYQTTFAVPNGEKVVAEVTALSGTQEATSTQSNQLDVVGLIPAPTVSAMPGDGTIDVQFGAPANLNGATPTAAWIYWMGVSGQVHSVRIPLRNLTDDHGVYSYALTGLTNGETYTVWVAWENQLSQIGQAGLGTNPATGSTSITPYFGFSGSITAAVTATPVRSGTVAVSFTQLAAEYSPVYEIRYGPSAQGFTTTMQVPASETATNGTYTVDVSGLTNGTSYTFEVVAYAGFYGNTSSGGMLDEGTATATPEGLPGAVTLSSLTPGNGSFTATWTPPADGGSALTGFVLMADPASGGTPTSVTIHANGAALYRYTMTGLTDGEPYTVTIYATNGIGNGPTSTYHVVPETPYAPPTVGTVTATAGDTLVTLSIPQATPGNSASPVTGYQYRYGPTASGYGSWTDVPSSELATNPISLPVTGLTNGTTYSFEVRACAGSVCADYPAVEATPVAPVSTRPVTLPVQVTDIPFAMIGADGGYFNHGGAVFANSLVGEHIDTRAIVGGAPAGTTGYWMVTSNGTVYAFGTAATNFPQSYQIQGTVVGMASTPDGGGYWIATNTGNVYAYGNAVNYGGVSIYGITGLSGSHPLNAPIVGIAALPDGQGYYLVAADGGVFNFGAAQFHGTTYDYGITGLSGPHPLNAPIVGMAVTPGGNGYILIGADGGVFNFGSAQFQGSTYSLGLTGLSGPYPLAKPVVGGAFGPTVDGVQSYYLFAADGGVFNFGSAGYEGSDATLKLQAPIVGGFTFPQS